MNRDDGEVVRVVDGFIEREAARLKGRRADDADGGKVLSFLAGATLMALVLGCVWALVA